ASALPNLVWAIEFSIWPRSLIRGERRSKCRWNRAGADLAALASGRAVRGAPVHSDQAAALGPGGKLPVGAAAAMLARSAPVLPRIRVAGPVRRPRRPGQRRGPHRAVERL